MPIRFACTALLASPPRRIAEQILNLANWANFRGYGPLPGIRTAEFSLRTPDVIGTRIQVVNTDGSQHVEEITRWEPEQGVTLKMHEFTPPLARLATHIDEVWKFTPGAAGTLVERAFTLHPRSWPAGLALRLIAPLLRRAVDRHLAEMRVQEQARQTA